MSHVIYAIIDPRCDQVFYIGQTSSYAKRCAQHLEGRDSFSGLTIRQIGKNGFVPLFIRLERCANKSSALMAEIFWIELFRTRATKLTNAQSYSGYVERARERKRNEQTLACMNHSKAFDSGLEAIANGRPSRQGKSWSRQEDKRLLAMQGKKLSTETMADALDRSMAAIHLRLKALGKSKANRRKRSPGNRTPST